MNNSTKRHGWLIALVMLFSSPAVHALGLGEMTVYSRLNQLLNAEVEILTTNLDELAGIKVQLASRESFQREKMPYVHSQLSGLRFGVSVKPSGQAVIRVTSKHPLREPILRFMVDVAWEKGRMLRGYEAAINPPR